MKKTSSRTLSGQPTLRVGIVMPHIFMQRAILPQVIFAPGQLSINLAEGLKALGVDTTLFTPGPVDTTVKNLTADLSYFEAELRTRGDNYLDLLKNHPLTFISLARQVQSELIAKAYDMANTGQFDIVHIYANEEDIALPFAKLCNQPVVFTHHDPFNFLIKYKSVFPKYKTLNWISISFSQRRGMPPDTNWVGNVYHGLSEDSWPPKYKSANNYIAYMGRIIEPKGLHLAIQAVQKYNSAHDRKYVLKIAGKHYSGNQKDTYWQKHIAPLLNDPNIRYIGFISDIDKKQSLLGSAAALIIPSIFDEPFGLVAIEALACATPVICLDSGALPEIIKNKLNGLVIKKSFTNNKFNSDKAIDDLAGAIGQISKIDRWICRKTFLASFTAKRMCQDYQAIYKRLIQAPKE